MLFLFILEFGGINGFWLEHLTPQDGYSSLNVVEEGGSQGGKWSLKVGEIELESGLMSAAINEDAPFAADENFIDVNCYQNCVGNNGYCNEKWLIAYDQITYVPPGKVLKSDRAKKLYISL